MNLEERINIILDTVQAEYLVEEIGKYVERMNVRVSFQNDIPFLEVYHITFTVPEAQELLNRIVNHYANLKPKEEGLVMPKNMTPMVILNKAKQQFGGNGVIDFDDYDLNKISEELCQIV